MNETSSARPEALRAYADLGLAWHDRLKHAAWLLNAASQSYGATCIDYAISACGVEQGILAVAEELAAIDREIRQAGLDFAAADTGAAEGAPKPLGATTPGLGGDQTLALPQRDLPPLDLSQPTAEEPGLVDRLMQTSGIVADPTLAKAQWLMRNASGWDWFLGFSYVSLSFVRDLDYLALSFLVPEAGVAIQATRAAATWGTALRDGDGYEDAIIQTALLSLAAFGLYLSRMPISTVGPPAGPGALQLAPGGAVALSSATLNPAIVGRSLVIAGELANALFARGNPSDLSGQGFDQEQHVRDALTQEGYLQPYGSDDKEIAKNLGIKGKVADFVGYNPETDAWLIVESKGGNLDHAVKQIRNTNDGLTNQQGLVNTEYRIYTNPDQYSKFSTDDGLSGYKLDSNGYLGWVEESTMEWMYADIDGTNIRVQVLPYE